MNTRTGKRIGALFFLFLISFQARGESFRTLITGVQKVSLSEPKGSSLSLSYTGASLIVMEGDTRFFRGLQLELTAPQNFLPHRGALAAVLYGELNNVPAGALDSGGDSPSGGSPSVADLEGRRLGMDPLPARIQNIYAIPLKDGHGFRTSPYTTVLSGVAPPSSFPLLFRLMPVIKGISDELEKMAFTLHVKPILSEEGALRLALRYPENAPAKPLRVLIDDEEIENPEEERLIREGEHRLAILSEDYRNQSSRFVIERAKILDLAVELLDTAPLVIFEYPENARVFLDNEPISDPGSPLPIEPGVHELRFQVSDYTITRSLTAQKGKTYRVALSIDVNISETE